MISRCFSYSVLLVATLIVLHEPAYAQMDSLEIASPVQVGNLTVFFISSLRPEATTPEYLTLSEALRQGKAILHNENSQTLWIENRADHALFIQAGDLIKGGQQDRILRYDKIVAAGDTDLDVTVLCIEHNRSTKRGAEPIEYFTSSDHMAPLHHLRVTPKSDLTHLLLTPRIAQSEATTAPSEESRLLINELSHTTANPFSNEDFLHELTQESVWHDVEEVQRKLQILVKDSVQARISPSSLELTMENERVQQSLSKDVKSLAKALKDYPNAIGFAYAINGELIGAELYRDRILFKSVCGKVFESAVAEAQMSGVPTSDPAAVSREEVEDMLAIATNAHFLNKEVNSRTRVGVVESQQFYLFETLDTSTPSIPVHRSYLKK